MKKLIATISVVAALGIGAFALNSVLPASAGGLAPQTPQAVDQTAQCATARPGLKDVLDKLVLDGKINQDQENTILQAVKDAHQSFKSNQAPAAVPRLRVLKGMVDISAAKIGVSADDLKTAIQGGQSVADVATAHSVAPADVEKAIVDAGTAKVDQAVTAGTITDQQGSAMKARLPELANKFVNRTVQPGCGPAGKANRNGANGANGSDNSSSTESSSS